jgi:glutamine synthetase
MSDSKTIVEATYIWLDGDKTPATRYKMKLIEIEVSLLNHVVKNELLKEIPEWGFDGSSTNQATGKNSDCLLKPVRVVIDPFKGAPNVLVLCEVMLPNGQCHPSNSRQHLRAIIERHKDLEAQCGLEQEYVLIDEATGQPLGFPANPRFTLPAQGPYYCSTKNLGSVGREVVEMHVATCRKAGLAFYGINAEVAPGQAEFQIGTADLLRAADDLWLARFLLELIARDHGLDVSYDPKLHPDWNGSGCHTNFSTKAMRNEATAAVAIEEAGRKLKLVHNEHLIVYGEENQKRLIGHHETSSYGTFSMGRADRTASVRIPPSGTYFEDRRPAANCDPYKVLTALLTTVAGDDLSFSSAKATSMMYDHEKYLKSA